MARGHAVGRGPGAGAGPLPLAGFASQIDLLKEEVFDICAALAQWESLLRGLGMTAVAARVSSLFDRVEGRLVQGQPSEAGVFSLGS
jgi:hypothetical protein